MSRRSGWRWQIPAVSGALAAAMAAAPAAQDYPPPFPRPNATKLVETDRIAVWDIVWPKGQPTVLHRHPFDQVGTYYQRGGRVITTPDGAARTTVTEVGSLSTTKRGTTHVEEGNTDPPLRAVFIELKKDGPSGLPPSRLDGRAPFPRAGAKQVLDDERVTIWDTAWQAGPDALAYAARRETIVVWLGSGTLRVTSPGQAPATVTLKAGSNRYLPRDSQETLEIVAGSPRTMFFELK